MRAGDKLPVSEQASGGCSARPTTAGEGGIRKGTSGEKAVGDGGWRVLQVQWSLEGWKKGEQEGWA